MKKSLLYTAAIFAVSVFLFSCKGDPGAQGPAGATGAGVVTVSFQDGVYPGQSYSGSSDNTMFDNPANNNYGACDYLIIGHFSGGPTVYRALVKYDLTYIVPANVAVKEAYLTLYFTGGSDIKGTTTVTAYALTRAWTEGTTSCSGSADVNSSWQYYNGAGNSWTSAGGDYNASAMSNSVVLSDSNPVSYVVLALDAATVQGWISDPSSNYGMILKATDETTGINWIRPISKESATATTRPKLTVYYTLP